MSEWILKKKEEILQQSVDLTVLSESLVTDRKLKRKFYKNKPKTIDNITFEADYPQVCPTRLIFVFFFFSTLISGCYSQIAIWRGDITCLEIDCIVNSANEGLLGSLSSLWSFHRLLVFLVSFVNSIGGGGIDEAIHGAAGPLLQRECAALPLCYPGHAVITKGYKLPAEKVIHAVGPYFDDNGDPQPEILRQTYESILQLVDENAIRTIALCPISTGFYGHPKELAADISMSVVLRWLQKKDPVEIERFRIIFCAFDDANLSAYKAAFRKHVAEINKIIKE